VRIYKLTICFLFLGLLDTGLGIKISNAGELRLNGPLVQGGLITGHAKPGALVIFNGRKLRISEQGEFIIGFGRNAKDTSTLHVRNSNTSEVLKTLAIKQRKYAIQRIDGLPSRQVTPKPKDLSRIKVDNKKITKIRRLDTEDIGFTSGFQWPAEGPITGVFGSQRILNGNAKNPHNGVDIGAQKGSPVTAAANGNIALIHKDMFYTGKTVMIDHGHGLTSIYVHLDKILVRENQQVRRGQLIGTVGSTGRVTGPHLHWGVSLFDVHLDPALLVGTMTLFNAAVGK
jgi:murein DD-endopeptidase MepM/ murein hydrolase activator NlpD